ncbi:MAG: hypothetical protein AAGG38_00720 [Planctomycetota bacterium]
MSSITAVLDPQTDRGLAPADLASAYLRRAGGPAVVRYLVAVAPLAAAAWVFIDAVTAQDRRALGAASLMIVGAMLWRWVGLAWVQARVMRDAGRPARWRWGAVAGVVASRLIAHMVLVWGGLLVLPAIVAFHFSGFAAVGVLEPGRRGVLGALGEMLKLVWSNLRAVWLSSVVLMVYFFLGTLSLMLVQGMLIWLVLPSLFGIDTTDLKLAAGGAAWWLSLVFLAWLVFDLFWHVAAVFAVIDLQARQTGGDLLSRLRRLPGGGA